MILFIKIEKAIHVFGICGLVARIDRKIRNIAIYYFAG